VTADAQLTEYRSWFGVGLLAFGVVANPFVVGWVFAPDGSIDGEARNWQIIAVDVFCIVAGTALASRTVQTLFRPYVRNAVIGAALVALTTAALVAPAWGIWAYRRAHQHTHYVGAEQPPTDDERRWANDFVQQSFESARRQGWLDLAKAESDGFVPQWSDGGHWVNREFLFDDHILDPARPEFLMYSDSTSGKVLTGFMYYTRTLAERGPTPGGSIAQWHYHPWSGRGFCAERELLVVSRPNEDGTCPAGVRVDRSAEMLHVWFVDHPLGPFADVMTFPQQKSMRDPTLLHPLVVHFGIALVILSVLLDVVGYLARRPVLHTVAAANLFIGALATIAAVSTGMLAEVQLVIAHEVHEVLDAHKLFGFSALGGVVLLGVWRLLTRGSFPAGARTVYLGVALLTATLTALAGHRGAELVFVHGAAVQAVDRFAMERYLRSVYGGPTLHAPPATSTHKGH
jgi:uncharacterized membrane protein